MDFYRHQAERRRQSRWLLCLYVSGVVALGLLSSALITAMLLPIRWLLTPPDSQHPLFSATEMIGLTCAVMFISLLVSVLRYQSLRQGGWKVAQLLGGRRLAIRPAALKEQQLRNVVEEMALASNLPVPAIFVQDEERGINAFAAGSTIHDAVIVVTAGALDALDRDELQAMVAHEVSHIYHGDIRLNTLLAAALSGLLFITRVAIWINQFGQTRTRRYERSATPLLQESLAALGYGGVLFGRLLGAAVNRQREALADASAVQFCRHPEALANALKKVAGHPYASLVFHPASAEFQHLFFAQGLPQTFAGKLATHPPLSERIRLLQPDWDGCYIRTGARMTPDEYRETADIPAPQRPNRDLTTNWQVTPHQTVSISELDLDAPQEWMPFLPTALRDAVHDDTLAPCVIAAMLLSTDLAIRHRQLKAHPDGEHVDAMSRFEIPRKLRLGVLELALATLRQRASAELDSMLAQWRQLIEADQQVSLTEWLIFQLATHQLTPRVHSTAPLRQLESCLTPLNVLLNKLDLAASEQSAQHHPLCNRVLAQLGLPQVPPVSASSWETIEQALAQLKLASPGIRLKILQGLAVIMEQDGQITDIEFELFRVLSLCFDMPMAPLRQGMTITNPATGS